MNGEPSEADNGSSEKIDDVHILTESLKTLNINPDGDEKGSKKESVKPSYTTRGPIGGKPSRYQYSATDKPMQMPPMPINFGAGQNYMAYHAQMQEPGRRMPEESPQQPYKYTRPQPQLEMAKQQFAPVLQNNQLAMQSNFCNNPSQPSNSGQQTNFSNTPQMFNFGADPTTATPTKTQTRLMESSPRGIVKVQSKVSGIQALFSNTDGNMVDDFLDGLNIPNFSQLADNIATRSETNQLPSSSVQPGQINNTDSRKSLTGARRCSDQDSGFESAEEKSPYSVQTPTPASSVCASPSSFDSGCKRSQKRETFPTDKGCVMNGNSSPKYPGPGYFGEEIPFMTGPGIQSSASYHTTAHVRPMAPQNSEELFDEKRIIDLSDVLDVIGHDLTSNEKLDQNLSKSIQSQQMEISKLTPNKQPVASVAPMTNLYRVNRPLNASPKTKQNVVPVPPQQIQTSILSQAARIVPDQPVPTAPAMLNIPATSGPVPTAPAILNIPATSGQAPNIIICIVPVSDPPQKQKKQVRRKPRPILPKIPKPPVSTINNTTSGNNVMTSRGSSNKTDVTMAMLNNIDQFKNETEDLRLKLRERKVCK